MNYMYKATLRHVQIFPAWVHCGDTFLNIVHNCARIIERYYYY